jgi:tRNA 2-thiouridine synthesizing protein D
MKLSIVLHGSAFNAQANQSAFRFAKAALEAGHTLHRVFFYGDAVLMASNLNAPQRDEFNPRDQWSALAEQYDLDLVICIAAALKRGALNEAEAKRHEKSFANITAPFSLSGLGQLTDALIESDRVVTFGE